MDFSSVLAPDNLIYFYRGINLTIFISICVVFFGSIIGLLVTFAKRSRFKPLSWLVSLYVWIFRGTPMVVQISLAFAFSQLNNLPVFDVWGLMDMDLSRLIPGIVIISLNSGAYISESFRAGLDSVPKGQIEAAYSLGMTPFHTMRYVVMPQAFKTILPALGNEFITIIKDSSLLQTIGVLELWNAASTVETNTYRTVEAKLVAALCYLVLTTILTAILSAIEKRMNGEQKR